MIAVHSTSSTSAVETVIKLVMKYNPDAIMVIKFTIPVGYTASVREKFGSKNIIFSPEFLENPKPFMITCIPLALLLVQISRMKD